MKGFNCPHCGKVIEKGIISKYFAMHGGLKSRRKLTPEDAKKMADKRWGKSKEKK